MMMKPFIVSNPSVLHVQRDVLLLLFINARFADVYSDYDYLTEYLQMSLKCVYDIPVVFFIKQGGSLVNR